MATMFNRLKNSFSIKTEHANTKMSTSAEDEQISLDISDAINKLEKKDKVGQAGDILATVGGVTAGAAVASSVATVAGASTLFGSTTLASILGGVFVTTTPVGWVIASVAIVGTAGFGVSKMIRSGSEQDHVRKGLIERLHKRLKTVKTSGMKQNVIIEFEQVMSIAIHHELITEPQANRTVSLIEQGTLEPSIALDRIKSMVISKGIIIET